MYGTAAELKIETGVKPQDLGLETEAELTAALENMLAKATNMINEDRNRDYEKEVAAGSREEVPAGIIDIALRIAANKIAQSILRRETPVVKRDDFEINMVTDEIFTDSIKKDLARYPFKSRMSMGRVNTQDEI